MRNKEGSLYTTRTASCLERNPEGIEGYNEGYVFSPPNKAKVWQPKRFFDPVKDKIFVREGGGWTKPKAGQLEYVTLPEINTYMDVYNLVSLYGYQCAFEMIGFSLTSFGDDYPKYEVAYMEKGGTSYVDWLEKIAELDYKILVYLCTELHLKVTTSIYDRWISSGEGDNYSCEFRISPFLGFHIYACMPSMIGMMGLTPHIDPIKFDDTLWKIIGKYHPDYLDYKNRAKYDSLSVRGWIELMCGKEDADWLADNLSFKPI